MILPRGPQRFWFVLTLVVMVVIVYLSDTLSTALLYTSLLTQFLVITTLATGIGEKHDKALGVDDVAVAGGAVFVPSALQSFDSDPEHFATSPVAKETPFSRDVPYPGGLSPADLAGAQYDVGPVPDIPAGFGSVYSPAGMEFAAGADGPQLPPYNPFQLNRLASRAEPGPRTVPMHEAISSGFGPVGMDAANEARRNFDGDRMMVEHARWRNDGQRVAAGIMRRKAHVEKYVREELDEKENEPWWGRFEL